MVVRVRGAGMCMTDIKIITGRLSDFISLPHIPGHEIAGDIVETGPDVEKLETGQPVIVYPVISCGSCVYCRTGNENLCAETRRIGFEEDGGFAEYVKVPAANVCPYEIGRPASDMAVLADAAGTPYHALTKIARPLPGRLLVIMGAGGLGLHAVQLAGMMGSVVAVCDVKDEALEAAAGFGADYCFNMRKDGDISAALMEISGGIGADIVLEGVGMQETVDLALASLRKQGIMIVMGYRPELGITIPFIELHNRELRLAGTKICTMQDLTEVVGLVERGLLQPVVTGTMPLEDLNEAFAVLKAGETVGRISMVN